MNARDNLFRGDGLLSEPIQKTVDALVQALESGNSHEWPALSEAIVQQGTPAVAPLLAIMQNPNYAFLTRAVAVQILGDLRDPSALGGLIDSLKDETLRYRAALSLGQIGDQRAAEPLLELLHNMKVDGDGWGTLALALANLGEVRAIPLLLDFVILPPDDDTSDRYQQGLGKFGEAAIPPIMEEIRKQEAIENATDSSAYQRLRQALNLAIDRMGIAGVEEIINLLSDASALLQTTGLMLLLASLEDRRNMRRALDFELQENYPRYYVRTDPTSEVREVNPEFLAALDDYRLRDLCRRALTSSDSVVRELAAEALGIYADANSVDALITALQDSSPSVRYCATESLGLIGDRKATVALADCLGDDMDFVRESAAEALKKLGDKRATSALIAAIDDESEEVHEAVLNALGELKDEKAFDALADRIWNDEDELDFAVLGNLVKYGERALFTFSNLLTDVDENIEQRELYRGLVPYANAAADVLVMALQDRRPIVRKNAAQLLWALCVLLEDDRVVPPLINALEDPQTAVRQAAADALGLFQDSRAVDPLINRLSDPERDVRMAAIRSLGIIRDMRAVPSLIDKLNASDFMERSQAADMLQHFQPPSIEPLLGMVGDPSLPAESREEAARLLSTSDDPRAIEAMRRLLDDPDQRIQFWAKRATDRFPVDLDSLLSNNGNGGNKKSENPDPDTAETNDEKP